MNNNNNNDKDYENKRITDRPAAINVFWIMVFVGVILFTCLVKS